MTTPEDDDDSPDDLEDLVAYLDGELEGAPRREVERRLQQDESARAEAEGLRKAWDLLDYLPRAEASADFTQRTLSRLEPVSAAAEVPAFAPVRVERSTLTLPATRPARPAWPGWSAAALAAFALALGVRYAARPAAPAPPERDPGTLALEDLRVIQNLPRYWGVEDMEFVWKLDESGLFAGDAP